MQFVLEKSTECMKTCVASFTLARTDRAPLRSVIPVRDSKSMSTVVSAMVNSPDYRNAENIQTETLFLTLAKTSKRRKGGSYLHSESQ